MDEKVKESLKWDPYVLLKNAGLEAFFASHFCASGGKRKLLYIMGEGFDYRMNLGIRSLVSKCPMIQPDCLLISYDEGRSSSSRKYKALVKTNMDALKALVTADKIQSKKIELWSAEGKKKKRTGDQHVAALFRDKAIFEPYTDIIVDISALPRGIYFSLIGQIQAIIDEYFVNNSPNFFVLTAENANLDSHIKEFKPDVELSYVYGFKGGSELTSENKKVIWLPILGEGSESQIKAAYDRASPDEICPVLPFPSRDPRRSDALLIEYHQLLFDGLDVEGQNIIYVAEQNPFQVYRTLFQTIIDYNETLQVLKGCDIVISTFSSKLLSIGALLCAYEFKQLKTIRVGILNVDSSGYEIDESELAGNEAEKSELFLLWLAGEPYKK